MDASPPGFTAMITMSRVDEMICGQNEMDDADTLFLLSSGHRLKKNDPMNGPAMEPMPATTELANHEMEKNTDAYSVRTDPNWYDTIVPARAAMAPETTNPVSFTRTGRMP